jgi:hypothetical protein
MTDQPVAGTDLSDTLDAIAEPGWASPVCETVSVMVRNLRDRDISDDLIAELVGAIHADPSVFGR